MKTLTLSFVLVSALLAGCGGNSQEASDPSKTHTTSETKPTDAKPADAKPADAKPGDLKTDAKPTDAKPADAKPADATCKEAAKVAAKDNASCMTECSKLENTVPAGSKCIPPRVSCEQQCKAMK